MKSGQDGFRRVTLASVALMLILSTGPVQATDTQDPCYQHIDEQRKRLPARLDIARMRSIANAITQVPWQVVPGRDTAPTHCAYHGLDPDLNAPAYWPGLGQPAPSEVGVPYKWGGSDNACEFKCLHDPQQCSGNVHPEQCPTLLKPNAFPNPRSAGLHHLLQPGDQACTTGIDCSGLVSVAWGLPWKLGTPNSSDNENWCALSFVAHEVTRVAVKHAEASSFDQAFWKFLQPGDALVMPGHVVLVDYPIGGLQGNSGACVWEASGHQQIKDGGKIIFEEQNAHRGTIDETWLLQQKNFHDYELIALRFNGEIVGRDQNLPPGEIPCGSAGPVALIPKPTQR